MIINERTSSVILLFQNYQLLYKNLNCQTVRIRSEHKKMMFTEKKKCINNEIKGYRLLSVQTISAYSHGSNSTKHSLAIYAESKTLFKILTFVKVIQNILYYECKKAHSLWILT